MTEFQFLGHYINMCVYLSIRVYYIRSVHGERAREGATMLAPAVWWSQESIANCFKFLFIERLCNCRKNVLCWGTVLMIWQSTCMVWVLKIRCMPCSYKGNVGIVLRARVVTSPCPVTFPTAGNITYPTWWPSWYLKTINILSLIMKPTNLVSSNGSSKCFHFT